MARGCGSDASGVGMAFLIFLALLTAFAAAVLGCFIWRMTIAADDCKVQRSIFQVFDDKPCRDETAKWIAIWTLCVILILCAVVFGWLWFCCCRGLLCGILFIIVAGIGMVFFIVLLALYGVDNDNTYIRYRKLTCELAIGIVGMLILLGSVIVGILGMCCGMGGSYD